MSEEIPLVSVIVPVYKVEPYLRRCIDSILCQTYRNLEIILVDDGSPDNCGAICDEYALKDTRIKVIHKVNTGVSAARNTGLDNAKGKYVGFVDSDDHIVPEMYERMTMAIESNDADIVFCSYFSEVSPVNVKSDYSVELSLPTEEYQKRMRYGMSSVEVWSRLFRRTLFEAIRFPEGRRYEDFIIMPALYDKANKIVGMDDRLYYYNLYNTSSIMALTNKTLENQFEELCVYVERVRSVDSDDKRFYQNAVRLAINRAFYVLMNNVVVPFMTRQQQDYVLTFLKENQYRSKRKGLWFCYKYCPFVFNAYSRYRFRKMQAKRSR